jgi:magnesium transporter
LEVNLATALLAAWVISRFQSVIAALPIIAAWQSVVASMGGNAGAQALAVAIRGIALGQSAPRLLGRVLYREFLVGFFEGIAIGLTCWAFAALGIFGHSDHAISTIFATTFSDCGGFFVTLYLAQHFLHWVK